MHRNAFYGPLFVRVANVFAKYCMAKVLPCPHLTLNATSAGVNCCRHLHHCRCKRESGPNSLPGSHTRNSREFSDFPALPTLRCDATRYWRKTSCSPFALRPLHSLRPLQGGEFRRHTKAPSRSIAPKAEGITQTVQPWRRLSDTRRNRLRDLPCKEAALPPEQLPVTPVARGEGGEGPKPLPRPVV